jgi:O-antigen/teichoic acid export membrane protein
MVTRNILANYLGQGWSAVIGLILIPAYIQYLGVEAYGLIGLFGVMQASLALLDMGMMPTLNREMARFTGQAHNSESIRALLRSFETLCLAVTAIFVLGVGACAKYLATDWLNARDLPADVVAGGLTVMAFAAGLRFCEGIYRGSLLGLQLQVWYNGAYTLLSTLRHAGALLVLAWISPTVQAFFIWQAVISIVTLVVLAAKVHGTLPQALSSPKIFSAHALAGIWKFAGGMTTIAVLSLLLTQIDKILLSKLLPLDEFGYYTLAASAASSVLAVVIPLSSAVYPRMVELLTQGDHEALTGLYHSSSQMVTVMTSPMVCLLWSFSQAIVFVWSGDPGLAEKTAPLLSLLAAGSFLNGLMQMPYHLQLAQGWTGLSVKVNVVAVVALIPSLLWAVPRFGATGAAWIWVALNAGYVLFAVQLMHLRVMPKEKWRWYLFDVLLPMAGPIGIMIMAQQVQPASYENRVVWLWFIGGVGVLGLAAAAMLADKVRSQMFGVANLLRADQAPTRAQSS